jgi:hypothetical protein
MKSHEPLKMYFDDLRVYRHILYLLQVNCPFKDCGFKADIKDQLKNHVKTHGVELCGVCLEHKNVFTLELPLYSNSLLQKHMKEGEREEAKKSNFKG